ncbi:hypothetical protein HYH03_006236 [Edaphochlamys debaryana]|uniref:Mini-chromosome maintenance complex-binding protein n=1 Tax=Edaphochlamys debaryana TaxID=47281 RepID=A0A835Y7J8_9CHLO|nr:hypothetical protein HYH03_006236 [Edaphochlamys debaryana]|eukprot:KAG2495636.1 hypothetical protein HYH03_006236 [Edaphochlamys debaryana]
MTIPEIAARPVEAIQRLYREAGCPTSSDGDWGVLSHFTQAVSGLGVNEIPLLNAQSVERLPHHSLVRFYGMVQDLLNPEYYVGAFQQTPGGPWVTSKFCDPDCGAADEPESGPQPPIWERRPVVCVPIPGLSPWAVPSASASAAATQSASAAAAATLEQVMQEATAAVAEAAAARPTAAARSAVKRERSSDADAQMDAASDAAGGGGGSAVDGVGASTATLSRVPEQTGAAEGEDEDMRPDTERAGDQGPPDAAAAAISGSPAEANRPRTRRREDTAAAGAPAEAAPAAAATAAATGAGSAAPSAGPEVPGEVPGSCIVYLYDNAPALVLHEVVEVVGILSHMPQLAALEYDSGPSEPLLERGLASLELGAPGAGRQGQGAAAPQQGEGQQVEGAANAAAEGQQGQGEATVDAAGESLAFAAIRAAHPPTSKVMRLHGIIIRRSPPLVPPAPTPTPTPAPAPAPAASPRDAALSLLRWALGGDALAAQYVLMVLVARVGARGDPSALGQLALNISRCPAAPAPAAGASSAAAPLASGASPVLAAERLGPRGPAPFAQALAAAVGALVPLCAALPLTVDGCNGVSWAPARDPSRERTAPSPLQLPPGCCLVLDETVMEAGQLGPKGIASLQAIMAVARQQQLLYDYESFNHPVPTDLPMLVLTQGRSLLRDVLPVSLPLNPTQPLPAPEEVAAFCAPSPSSSAAAPAPAPAAAGSARLPEVGDLSAVRSYFAAVRADDSYSLADGMPSVLEQYFVEARRAAGAAVAAAGPGQAQNAAAAAAANAAMSAEDFHLKLTLARLLAWSHGERQLTPQRWAQLLELEHAREARLRVAA